MLVKLIALDFLLLAVAGLGNEHQLRVIEYLLEENRILREMLGKKRLRFTDHQRRRLAVKAKLLSRAVLNQIATIVTPDTLLRWHRQLIAMKWDYSSRRGPGRPRIAVTIRRLVVHFALENRWWGYTKIQGALAHIGHSVSRESIANILRENGIEPALEGADLYELVDEWYWEQIFEEELEAWMTDASTWPQQRSADMFHEWFEVELVTMVLDAGRGRIKFK